MHQKQVTFALTKLCTLYHVCHVRGGGRDVDLFTFAVIPNMEREQLVGKGNSDSDSEVAGTSKGSSDEHAVPEKRVSKGDKEPPTSMSIHLGGPCMFSSSPVICPCRLLICLGNRRSVAGNFDMLTSTLHEAKMRELALKERRLKLEEDKLKFEHEKWLQEQAKQDRGMSPQQHCFSDVSDDSDVRSLQPLQPVHYFANDNIVVRTSPVGRVLHPSEY